MTVFFSWELPVVVYPSINTLMPGMGSFMDRNDGSSIPQLIHLLEVHMHCRTRGTTPVYSMLKHYLMGYSYMCILEYNLLHLHISWFFVLPIIQCTYIFKYIHVDKKHFFTQLRIWCSDPPNRKHNALLSIWCLRNSSYRNLAFIACTSKCLICPRKNKPSNVIDFSSTCSLCRHLY